MNTENTTATTTTDTTVNTDELATSIQSVIRGTDNNGNYQFMDYNPKAPVTPNKEGYRVAKLMYKVNPKTGKAAADNACLIVPHITESEVRENIDSLIKHVVTMLESEQDKIIRSYHLDKVSFVEPSQIDIPAIITALETVAVSGRLNKDMITVWFDQYILNELTTLCADNLGLTADTLETALADKESRLNLMLKAYKDMLVKLASNTTIYQPPQAEKLLKAIELCVADSEEAKADTVTVRLMDKLSNQMKPVDMVELLGF